MWEWGKVVCWWAPAVAVPGGKWIPYSAAQVVLRRAARLVCVVIGMGTGEAVLAPAALPAYESVPPSLGYFDNEYPAVLFVSSEFPSEFPSELSEATSPISFLTATPNTSISTNSAPEPSSLFILIAGLGILVAINEGKRHTMRSRNPDLKWFRPDDWPEGPRQIEPFAEDSCDRDETAPGRGVVFGVILGTLLWIGIIVAVLLFLPAWKLGLL